MGSKYQAFCACFGVGCRLLLRCWLQFLAYVGWCSWFAAVGLKIIRIRRMIKLDQKEKDRT
ncbi:transmembrane protein, putative [Medicago truncatula]|uniref:Transmembrane protein, putative n=1 Tax=Medicago truncatula TaxID=3880 RepID=G7I7B0_MEDTR|nr:transmembrane protein, putative [Medicago truncatula]